VPYQPPAAGRAAKDGGKRCNFVDHGAPPETEYVLVSAIEATGQAWVEINAGIDVNPVALTLPSVPLAA
jgi:hypothetical protein